MEQMQTIQGRIEKIIYQNPQTRYTILLLSRNQAKPMVVKGAIANAMEGLNLTVSGFYITDPKYGLQMQATEWTVKNPADKAGIIRYITNFTDGIGEAYAKRIVDYFGDETIDIMNNSIQRLREVPGIGKKRLQKISESWTRQMSFQKVMLALQKYGISTLMSLKIYHYYGTEASDIIAKNPYQLVDDIFGIGFKTADRIALDMGFEKDGYFRIRSAVSYVLNQLANNGDVYAAREQLVKQAIQLLDLDEVKLQATIDNMRHNQDEIIDDGDDAIYLKPFLYAEQGIANHLKRLRGFSPLPCNIDDIESELGIRYAPEQRKAIEETMEHKVMVLTGGPGTGKTTVTKGIIQAFKNNKLEVLLAAPTGRAAKRMEETTGMQASTIHRLLGFNPESGFVFDRENPIDSGNVLILDEASMIDTVLMNAVLRALPDFMRVVIIGDSNQLPSVGAGTVLRDIIDSGEIPVLELRKIFRQAQESRIIANCHAVIQGEMPELKNDKDSDFFFVHCENVDEIKDTVIDLVSRRLPQTYQVQPTDIQVLTPQKTSEIGTIALNEALQKTLNANPFCCTVGDRKFKIGDKVMQIKNNYDKEVFNGDVGFVTGFDNHNKKLSVQFESKTVEYDLFDLNELILAYAITIHKSQGSEYPIVVMPIHQINYYMLERHLVYTGFSRAKQLLVVVGSRQAMQIAVKRESVSKRNTKLKKRLEENT